MIRIGLRVKNVIIDRVFYFPRGMLFNIAPVYRPLFQDNLGKPVPERYKTSLDLKDGMPENRRTLQDAAEITCTSLFSQ